jgi:membrane-anchored protein YejM (alkaline phosphatase superfamily)
MAILRRTCEKMLAKIDQLIAARLTDLKQRDVLKGTLVIWGGEFGELLCPKGARGAIAITMDLQFGWQAAVCVAESPMARPTPLPL